VAVRRQRVELTGTANLAVTVGDLRSLQPHSTNAIDILRTVGAARAATCAPADQVLYRVMSSAKR
jgi:hypothetical protein